MGRTIRYGELLLGIEGASLFRHLLDGDDEFMQATGRRDPRAGRRLRRQAVVVRIDAPELDVAEGYAAWAPTYDAMPNALIRAEETFVAAVTAICRSVPPSTPRAVLVVTPRGSPRPGTPPPESTRTPAMLEVARARVPTATFELGDLTSLPVETAVSTSRSAR